MVNFNHLYNKNRLQVQAFFAGKGNPQQAKINTTLTIYEIHNTV